VDGFEREVIAIDGKTLRRSFDRRREQSQGSRMKVYDPMLWADCGERVDPEPA
jgi:hypothetical protein